MQRELDSVVDTYIAQVSRAPTSVQFLRKLQHDIDFVGHK